MYEYRLLIPKERVGVLVGDKGKIKRLIEQQTSTSLEIEQEEVSIKSEDSYKAWICQQIVKAIAKKKRVVFISKRWRLLSWLLYILPDRVIQKIIS